MKTVILTTFYNNVQAHMLQDLFEKRRHRVDAPRRIVRPSDSLLYSGLGIQVLVFEKDYERAREILKTSFPEEVEG